MQRAAQTFHMPTPDGWRTVAAGDELADDDPAVQAAPQYFTPAGADSAEPEQPAKRTGSRRTSTKKA
ncbi:unnamed protein product [[Actinomadura] parvosata subsp. kistnae]|uniref:Uncharacterized protein n=1 Tax=[Actinomadura] parvosata subsp. kistnae TaxID=1909395 RepID=A0A1V0ABP0_9ACTN|nr:hypothetical protein [Nonomuraea sp. ATCC 55076]AQZ67631.1 hypothetical protein BKM31_44740 [Nonomuraea sp. ATCC 55076]SPL94082.1 unnamed protein product [Actinomadura parvosata subsp. kistnae]